MQVMTVDAKQEAEFWFLKDDKRYWARVEGNQIIAIHAHTHGTKIEQLSLDEYSQQVQDGIISDFGIAQDKCYG